MSDDEATVGRRPADAPLPGRRQVEELTSDDLRTFPAWWFPPPDGRLSGPDASTVIPADATAADGDGACEFPDGRWLLRARFVLADGSELDGHVSYTTGERTDFASQEPTLCGPGGQAPLWHGILVPDAEHVARLLAALGRRRGAVFPLRWHAALHPVGQDLDGEAQGFGVWRNGRVEWV